jgi:hypothetical protein
MTSIASLQLCAGHMHLIRSLRPVERVVRANERPRSSSPFDFTFLLIGPLITEREYPPRTWAILSQSDSERTLSLLFLRSKYAPGTTCSPPPPFLAD